MVAFIIHYNSLYLSINYIHYITFHKFKLLKVYNFENIHLLYHHMNSIKKATNVAFGRSH